MVCRNGTRWSQSSAYVGTIVFPACDVLNTDIRRWPVAGGCLQPVLVLQYPLVFPLMAAQARDLFKNHFPATKHLPGSFPPTYFAVAWETRRARYSPPKFQFWTAYVGPFSSSSPTIYFSLLHFRTSPIELRSMRPPSFASSRTAPRRSPITSNPKATLVAHGT